MKITILTVGSKPTAEITVLVNEYLNRLPKNIQVSWSYIKHEQGDRKKSVARESENILRKLKKETKVILLDETGLQIKSEGLSNMLFNNPIDITFIIGGAYGVSEEVKQKVDFSWSLGKLVYPHQLVKVILSEQIYRSYCISIGHPYHHD